MQNGLAICGVWAGGCRLYFLGDWWNPLSCSGGEKREQSYPGRLSSRLLRDIIASFLGIEWGTES